MTLIQSNLLALLYACQSAYATRSVFNILFHFSSNIENKNRNKMILVRSLH